MHNRNRSRIFVRVGHEMYLVEKIIFSINHIIFRTTLSKISIFWFSKNSSQKNSSQKNSPNKILQKNSSQKNPPKNHSKKFQKIPQKSPKNQKKKKIQTISQKSFWKYPIPYIALRGRKPFRACFSKNVPNFCRPGSWFWSVVKFVHWFKWSIWNLNLERTLRHNVRIICGRTFPRKTLMIKRYKYLVYSSGPNKQ